jgi:hypothetical protein
MLTLSGGLGGNNNVVLVSKINIHDDIVITQNNSKSICFININDKSSEKVSPPQKPKNMIWSFTV